MGSTTTLAGRSLKWLIIAIGTLLAATLLVLQTPGAARADAPDEPGGDQEQTSFYFAGTITNKDEPLADVRVSVEGNGFDAETLTGADGRWRLYVPEKDTYSLEVDESTLPDGVIVENNPRDVEFGLTGSAIVNIFLSPGERTQTSFLDQVLDRLMNGLNFGLLLALAAIGVSLIFGTTGLTNFAHAEMITFGAVIALVFGVWLAWPMWIVIPVVILLGGVLGWTLDAGLWQPLRRKGLGLVQVMIVSIGLSLAGRYLFQFFIGGSTYQLPGAGGARDITLGPISLSLLDVISMGISIVLLAAVAFWLLRTRIGKATRAISDNPGLAAASGINVDRVIRIVWILSAALAAIAGVLWAYFRPGIKWDMGTQVLLLVFAAVTLGGLGTAFGALLGAIIVGILVEISTLWIPPDMKYVGALAVLIIILLVRPQGILGRKERLG
ncbi:branched-chain amino acid ABC transporter permease [Microbacterium sp. zg.B48]|uniref:branched-chain amino acid ABC transporter permease n=1 Tax=unclassified Microbacterium TaxID=2609290 RepID=UPI00214B6E57|nr:MULTISPECIES: branched-chain amino acid ABC transporter permease [unclassified Microbacterium]MCR2764159.1 branched-chain amino acid ABC transporter permease [Microbacterium sp. zg.B48]MCR2808974.1 branched-chain amino acid ABC transporter permease [Microbacterium sp. zg.B185]WIM18612.1 branched-chain amino acid ABC transporter permease [Microbacterium sp. zg-B185]